MASDKATTNNDGRLILVRRAGTNATATDGTQPATFMALDLSKRKSELWAIFGKPVNGPPDLNNVFRQKLVQTLHRT